MPRINWDALGSRFYEVGVDRGVLYIDDDPGVPWNGLISVTENKVGGESKAYYLDGERYLTRISPTEFSAALRAFSSPEEFEKVDGTLEIYDGLYSTGQPRRSFGLSYRTLLGNDLQGQNFGYKIHLLYNVQASPSNQELNTISSNMDLSPLTWDLVGTPSQVGPNHRPTAHFIVDSTRVSPEVLAEVEAELYGSDEVVAGLPSVPELLAIFASFALFRVTLLPNNRYSAEGSSVVDLGGGEFEMEDSTVIDNGDNTFSIL